jgi:hypothetical protein
MTAIELILTIYFTGVFVFLCNGLSFLKGYMRWEICLLALFWPIHNTLFLVYKLFNGLFRFFKERVG